MFGANAYFGDGFLNDFGDFRGQVVHADLLAFRVDYCGYSALQSPGIMITCFNRAGFFDWIVKHQTNGFDFTLDDDVRTLLMAKELVASLMVPIAMQGPKMSAGKTGMEIHIPMGGRSK